MVKTETNIHGILVPHAPTLLKDELNHKNSAIIIELQSIGRKLKSWGVQVVVAVSTHWQTDDKFFIDNSPWHKTLTDYYGFRSEVEYDVAGYPELAGLLLEAGHRNLIFPSVGLHGADHAITVPLHFMFPDRDIPVIPLSVSGSLLCAFRWGRTLGTTLRNWGGKTLFLSSGSLSHDLSSFMSGHRTAEHEEFDFQVLGLLAQGKGIDVAKLDPNLIKLAKLGGEFRDLFMLLGVMGSQTPGYVRAYEKLPGVGLGVVEFPDVGYSQRDENLLKEYQANGLIH